MFTDANGTGDKKVPFGQKKSKGNFGNKRSSIKKKAKKNKPLKEGVDLLDESITLRFSATEVKRRVIWIKDNIGFCQVCGSYHNPDYPHHALDGTGRKDDRTMVDICTICHSIIHTKGFDSLPITEEQLVKISWNNNKRILADSKNI